MNIHDAAKHLYDGGLGGQSLRKILWVWEAACENMNLEVEVDLVLKEARLIQYAPAKCLTFRGRDRAVARRFHQRVLDISASGRMQRGEMLEAIVKLMEHYRRPTRWDKVLVFFARLFPQFGSNQPVL